MSQSTGGSTRRVSQADQPLNRTPEGEGAYPDALVPVARPGDVVQMKPRDQAFAVEAVVPQPGLIEFDSEDSNTLNVGANSTSDKQELTNLQQDNGWLAQLRFLSPSELPDGVRVEVDLSGRQAQFYSANNSLGVITPNTGVEEADDDAGNGTVDDISGALTEFYLFEQEELFFTFVNTTGSQVTVQDLTFAGFQYQLTELDSVPSGVQPVVLPTQALG